MKRYIYQIINKIDGRRYVQDRPSIQKKRKQTHFSKLRKMSTQMNYYKMLGMKCREQFTEWELDKYSKIKNKKRNK